MSSRLAIHSASACARSSCSRSTAPAGRPTRSTRTVKHDRRYAPSSGDIVAEVPVGATPAAVSVGEGAVWVLNVDDRTISRIDPETKAVRTLAIGATPTDLVAGAGGVWIGSGGKLKRAQFAGATARAVTRLEPRTGAVRATIALRHPTSVVSNVSLHHLTVAAGAVWAIAPDFSIV